MPPRELNHQGYASLFKHEPPCVDRYVIPVAWHVIEVLSNVNRTLRQRQVEEVIDVMNEAFKHTSFRFKSVSLDFTQDGGKEGLIATRCQENMEPYMTHLAHSPSTTLNIYTCRSNNFGSSSLPWDYPEDCPYHGVEVHPDTLPGGPFSSYYGKLTVQQVGRYFGLHYVYEGGCYGEDDDEVEDTPRCKKAESLDCEKSPKDSCPNKPGLDPLDNFMNAVNETCMKRFTPGQIRRMMDKTDTYRNKLMLNSRQCQIDAIFRWIDGFVYMFAGSNFYHYNESRHGLDPGYPRPIADHWHGVPSSIDGAFRYGDDGNTYFFKGDKYYRYNEQTGQVDPGFPRSIDDFWTGVPRDIDDVISYANGFTYFFKDDKYYRYNPKTNSVDPGYPKAISAYWRGVPSGVEAAFNWYNGGVYFFKDGQFWFFIQDGTDAGVVSGYPKSVMRWWSDDVMIRGYTALRGCGVYSYFFLGSEYWRYNTLLHHVDIGFPKPRSEGWPGLPDQIQAAFVWRNCHRYFFHGSSYFLFNATAGHVEPGYPRSIASFWKGVPNNVDAVFRYVDGVTYFFKGSQYYRFNDDKVRVDPGYPRNISSFWKGIPNDIDTVFVWSDGHTYFFKANLFYRFNRESKQVDPGYPQSVSLWRGILYQP